MTIAERLKELREKKGMNKKEVANSLGIPYSTYNNWEIGAREPNSHNLKMIAKFYQVTIDHLMGFDEEIETIAAHKGNDEDWSDEELEDIRKFKEYVKMRRKQQD